MKSKYQRELESLPEWAQKMVRALSGSPAYTFGSPPDFLSDPEKYREFSVTLRKEAMSDWSDGFDAMKDLAVALSAPWPPPPAPEREKRAVNLVELVNLEDDSAFDQPCAFGNRCGGHAVYCHNEAWPDSPRKCRRTWYTGGRVRDEDCPGFVANPDYTAPERGPAHD